MRKEKRMEYSGNLSVKMDRWIGVDPIIVFHA